MYMPKPWTLTKDVMESEYAIFEQTGEEHGVKIRICVGLVALLYEQLLLLEGDVLSEVFPVTTDERAQKWYILAFASSVFLYSNTILDLTCRGRYLEAEALIRCLLENRATLEYFSKRQEECLTTFKSKKGAPEQGRVLNFLDAHGEFPKGGPRKVIRRFHAAAHGSIVERFRSWLVWDDNHTVVGISTHQYHSESVINITHHLVQPLLIAHQILFSAFEERMEVDRNLMEKWGSGRPMALIQSEFPDLWFTTELR